MAAQPNALGGSPSLNEGMSEGKNRRLWANWLMCWSLCAHFVGYELVRTASVALLTGLGDSNALGHTILAGFPLSALTLYLVHFLSETFGVRQTLRISQAITVLALALITYFCTYLSGSKDTLAKMCIIGIYCWREIYVGVIATQNWSFVKIPYDLLVKFSGLVSVASVLGSICVEFLVSAGGVKALLGVAIVLQCVSSGFAECYFALEHDIEPRVGENKGAPLKRSKSFYLQSADLMGQNATLRLLLLEAILHQGCSNLVNQLFYDGLRRHITSDTGRAVLIGRAFAVINLLSCIMQCVVVPTVMSPRRMPAFLISVPILVLLGTSVAFAGESLLSVMVGFGVLKVLEYSVMASATEMIYMPLEHEVRYLGKELIRFFGHRLGKSGTSLLLSAANSYFRPSAYTQTVWSSTVAAMWGASMFLLSKNLETDVVQLLEKRMRARSMGQSPSPEKDKEVIEGRAKDSSKSSESQPEPLALSTTNRFRAKSDVIAQATTVSPAVLRPRTRSATGACASVPPTLEQWLSSATAGQMWKRKESISAEENVPLRENNVRPGSLESREVRAASAAGEDAERKDENDWGELLGPEVELAEGFEDEEDASSLQDSLEPYVLVRTNSQSMSESWSPLSPRVLTSPDRDSRVR